MMDARNEQSTIVKTEDSKEYFAQRELKKGAVGWLLLVGLGVAYVISGDFAGWNFGIAQGGWGEMSTMLPTAGGGYSFARMAFGPFGGYLTGTAILIEYAIAPAAIATFIGAGEALKIMFVITAIAVVAVVVFLVAMIPHFNSANLFDIAVDSSKAGASSFLPQEGVPLAAEEAKDPAQSLPRVQVQQVQVSLKIQVHLWWMRWLNRHHLISGTPEEEFASIKAAEQEL
ncbi:unnamed protein product [Oppiella nova]|uniref:Ethanolamine permease n=1 Tax=Oppiella nova TaxID=334625 RepID=A0A7R9LB38_9ACAR|nr:unnamed protein product [Oppiella nova]CAG2159463.1 unnamed protein product [Oppiella nova]